MVKHIVMWWLKDDSPALKEQAKQKLLSMKGKAEILKDVEVGIDQMHSARSCDLCLVCTFDSFQDLAEYANHPVHVPVKEFMHSIMVKSVSCDYEL